MRREAIVPSLREAGDLLVAAQSVPPAERAWLLALACSLLDEVAEALGAPIRRTPLPPPDRLDC